MGTHERLLVWQKSMDFTVELYRVLKSFPKEEQFELASQMRRAAVSIPSNIAEGAARKGTKEYVQFLYVAYGSANELETQLILSNRLNYLTDEIFSELNVKIEEIKRMLYSLIKSL